MQSVIRLYSFKYTPLNSEIRPFTSDMKSDLTLDAFKFSPKAVSDEQNAYNDKLIEAGKAKPKFSRVSELSIY